MSERFKEPVLKTGDGETHRGFESHSLRHVCKPPLRVAFMLNEGSGVGVLAIIYNAVEAYFCPEKTESKDT